jgi:hypothetical protein
MYKCKCTTRNMYVHVIGETCGTRRVPFIIYVRNYIIQFLLVYLYIGMRAADMLLCSTMIMGIIVFILNTKYKDLRI